MYWITFLEAMAVLLFVVGLLNEKKIIRWEDRMIGKVRRWRHEKVSAGRVEGSR